LAISAKNYSAEDGIDGTAEQEKLGIPFRTILRKRKMLGILFARLITFAAAENLKNVSEKMPFEVRKNYFVKLFGCFIKLRKPFVLERDGWLSL
jgi:hypothetical protein